MRPKEHQDLIEHFCNITIHYCILNRIMHARSAVEYNETQRAAAATKRSLCSTGERACSLGQTGKNPVPFGWELTVWP